MIDKKVLPLTIGGLAIGTTEFTIMGLLPDIAQSMHITIPQAGHFISAYAFGVVVGAPLLIGYTARYSPRKVLFALMIMFTVFNGLSAAASGYTFMMISRFLSGLPHGAFFGVGTVVASRIAGPGREARYIARMFTGLTFANLAMVPLVTFIGHTFDWRWYFIIVGVIGLLTLLAIYLWLPSMAGRPNTNFKNELRFVKNRQAWYVLAITGIGFGGLFAWFSYISPLMTTVAGFQPKQMAWIMIIAGAGMVVGNIAGAIVADKMGAAKTIPLLMLAMMIALASVFFFAQYSWIALALTFICGALSMAVSAPINIMMMKAAPGAEMMGAAFMQAAFNFANSSGAYLGGVPLEHGLPYNYPSLVGMAMTFAGLLICMYYNYKYNSTGKMQLAA